jgi:hypothetical protein
VSSSAFPDRTQRDGARTPCDRGDARPPAARPARLLYVLLLVGAVGGAAVLFTSDPAAGGFYPPCVVHRSTGLHCPGCGSTRGLHALLHGRVWAAFRYNALMVLALPFLAAAFIRYTRHVFGWRDSGGHRRRVLPAAWIWALFGLVVAYSVLRNLPIRPFTWLAPTDVAAAPHSEGR